MVFFPQTRVNCEENKLRQTQIKGLCTKFLTSTSENCQKSSKEGKCERYRHHKAVPGEMRGLKVCAVLGGILGQQQDTGETLMTSEASMEFSY